MKSIEELTGLYSLSKTLRFELKPIGKTLEQIERKGLLTQDERTFLRLDTGNDSNVSIT